MPAAAVVTIIAVVIAVAVTAVFLLTIARTLRDISDSLDQVIDVVGQIPERTAPIPAVLGAINKDLSGGRAFLGQLLGGAPTEPIVAPRITRGGPPEPPHLPPREFAPAGAEQAPYFRPAPPEHSPQDGPEPTEHAPLRHPPKLLP
jgi:hypothetical protein